VYYTVHEKHKRSSAFVPANPNAASAYYSPHIRGPWHTYIRPLNRPTFYLWTMTNQIVKWKKYLLHASDSRHQQHEGCIASRILRLRDFSARGRFTRFFDCWFWKSDPYFILVWHCNYTSIVHRFRLNELFMFAGNDVIAISSVGALQVIYDYGFCKGDPDSISMFNWHFLSVFHGSDVTRFVYFAGNSLLGAKCVGVWGQNERETLAGRSLSHAKLRLLSHCA